MDFQESERLRKLPPYLFADLRVKMAAATAKGIKVIRIDIGDPDLPTPDPIVQEMIRAVDDREDPDRHRYGCDRPTKEFPCAIREFYKRRYQVALTDEQIVVTMGSKDAIAKTALALLDPGDLAIAPAPGYPTYNIGHVFAGASTYQVPLLPANGYLVDFDAIPPEVRSQAKILWLNYPNNPTTTLAPVEFFERAIEFGRQNNILIAHDFAYAANAYDGYIAPSILQVPGAHEVAIEFFSLSKCFNMTGWRSGFAVGNASTVKLLRTVKENIDNGIQRAIQFASAKGLDMAEKLIAPVNAV